MRDNPVIRIWLRSLKGRGLFAALVPLALGLMTPHWPNLPLGRGFSIPIGTSLSALLLMCWLTWRCLSMLNFARAKEKDGAFAATTLTPLEFFNGAVLILLIETLPFSVLYLIHFCGEMLGFDSGIVRGIVDPLAIVWGVIGGALLAGSLSLVPALRKAAPWLALPVAFVFFCSIFMLAIHHEVFWPLLKHKPELFTPLDEPQKISHILLVISLLPVTLLPGWTVALLATRSSLGKRFWKFAGVRTAILAVFILALVLIGQGASSWMYASLASRLDLHEGEIENYSTYRLTGSEQLLGPTKDGLLTWTQGIIYLYDESFNVLRMHERPFGHKGSMPRGALLDSGDIVLLGDDSIERYPPEDEVEILQWPQNLNHGTSASIPRPRHGSRINQNGLLCTVRSRPYGNQPPGVRLVNYETGKEVSYGVFKIPGDWKYSPGPQRISPQWTDDVFVFHPYSRRVDRYTLDGERVSFWHLPLWPWLFEGTDLEQPVTPPLRDLGYYTMHPDGQMIYVDDDYLSLERMSKNLLLICIYEPNGAPRSYLLDAGENVSYVEPFVLQEHLMIHGYSSGAVVWAIPLDKLGLRPLVEETPEP